ncbi:hypothetical protein F4804DRAFT_125737 [Jackrogersella minutella]|nr:hypothetical protein F4804DRAFT_125737 [Jackrogersella minutella]
MQFAAISLSLFAAFVAAQSNSTSLPDLVAQLPSCAAGCLSSSSKSAGCSAEDFTCLCGDKKDSFLSSITGCILTSGCSQDDIGKLSTLAPEICTAASSSDPSAVASASNIVSSAIATAASASATSTPGAAARPEIGLGLVGAAALAAFAL